MRDANVEWLLALHHQLVEQPNMHVAVLCGTGTAARGSKDTALSVLKDTAVSEFTFLGQEKEPP